jgi:4-hydroxythreonine-4-phosphate dehydrogenase
MPRDKPIVAIATGDPAGIGPEISLRAALDPAVRAACHPVLVSDPALLGRHAGPCNITLDLHVIERFADADPSGRRLNLLACPQPEAAAMALGKVSAAAGRASIACCGTAVRAALAGAVDAVVAAPQN